MSFVLLATFEAKTGSQMKNSLNKYCGIFKISSSKKVLDMLILNSLSGIEKEMVLSHHLIPQ